MNKLKWTLAITSAIRITIYVISGYFGIKFFNSGDWLVASLHFAFSLYGANATRKMMNDFKKIKEVTE